MNAFLQQRLPKRVQQRHFFVALSIIFILWLVPRAAAEKLPVRMKLIPILNRGRTGGPIPLQVKLEYNSPQIREGTLVLHIYNSIVSPSDRMATLRYEGIVLQGGDYLFNTILPPIEPSHSKIYQIVGWFETEDDRIPLTSDPKFTDPPEPHDLLTISALERVNTIASYSGQADFNAADAGRAKLNRILRLDRFNRMDLPKGVSRQLGAPQTLRMQSFIAKLNALDLPEDPLHLCSFDQVILADQALGMLSQLQLDSLMVWIRAGGSLCFANDDIQLKSRHVKFLRTLFERSDDPGFQLQPQDDGRLLVISNDDTPLCLRNMELGRVAFVPDLEATELSTTEEHNLVCHLWKVRKDSNVWSDDEWKPDSPEQLLKAHGVTVERRPDGIYETTGRRIAYGYGSELQVEDLHDALESYQCQPRLYAVANELSSAAETALLPEDIRIVPASLIAVLLLGYVLAIGPGDYFILGYFGLRKYTWILFPVVTVLFTLLTVWVANRYMASSENGSLLTITEIDQDGKPLRSTSLQMKFMSAQTNRDEDLSRSFVVPAQVTMNLNPNVGGVQSRPINPYLAYSGRFPNSYTMTQSLRQWEPQVTRTMTLTPDQTQFPQIDLSELDLNDELLFSTADGRKKIQQVLDGIVGWQVDAVVFHQDKVLPVCGGQMLNSRTLTQDSNWSNQQYYRYSYRRPETRELLASGLAAATLAKPFNYFDIVSRVAPQGAAYLEDLVLLDGSDPQQYVLMIALYNGTETHVFRRLLHAENS